MEGKRNAMVWGWGSGGGNSERSIYRPAGPGPVRTAGRPNDARLIIMGATATIVAPLRYVGRFTPRDYDVT